MGEDIEVRDIHGNLVRVPLHATLAAIGRTLHEGQSVAAPVNEENHVWVVASLDYRVPGDGE